MAFLLNSPIPTAILLVCCAVIQSIADVPCAPVRTRPCPNEDPKASLVGVYIQDCFEEPCLFKRDQTVTLELDVEFKEDIKNLEAELWALLIPTAPIKWNGINPRACEYIRSIKDCPFQPGDYVTYGTDLFIQPSFPPTKTDVMFKLLDDQGRTQVCWIVQAQVS